MAEPPSPVWAIEPLAPVHDRSAFSCGHPSLDDFLRRLAGQNARAGVSRTFVAVERGERAVRGYYALSAGRVELEHLPEDQRKRLPRHPVPVAHLGRLAVDAAWKGKGLGEHLLMDALARVQRVAASLGVYAVEVVAIDDAARGFYLKYGFVPLRDDERHLYLPLSTLGSLSLG